MIKKRPASHLHMFWKSVAVNKKAVLEFLEEATSALTSNIRHQRKRLVCAGPC